LVLERRTVFSDQAEFGILIHRTGYSDSIIARFPWSGGLKGTFATVSAIRVVFALQQTIISKFPETVIGETFGSFDQLIYREACD